MQDHIIYAGTIGQGVWRSSDAGESFSRACDGMFMEAEVRALAADPQDASTLYAGTDAGIYKTEDGGDGWRRLNVPFEDGGGWQAGTVVWALMVHPQRPSTIFAGTCPPALYRSDDAGDTWRKLDAEMTRDCPPIIYNRVTCIIADPDEPDAIWTGVEVDGVLRSRDGGDSWQRLGDGLSSQDVHALAVLPGRRILASTNNDLNISTDEGATWQPQGVPQHFPWRYCRGVTTWPTLMVGNGNGPPGTAGAIQMSHDGGLTWRQAQLPVEPNSTIWTFAALPPSLVYALSINGQLFRSEDAGETWTKCHHEFGEARAVVCVPTGVAPT